MAAISGIDWAAEHHDVRIADEHSGAVLAERRFAHDEAGIDTLTDLLISRGVVRGGDRAPGRAAGPPAGRRDHADRDPSRKAS